MRNWLIKSEPASYGWEDLVREGKTVWDGVRNHRAANNLRAMEVGDEAFFYHSVTGKQIVGIVRVTCARLADPGDEEGKWAAVEVSPIRTLAKPVTLTAIKAEPVLEAIELVRLSRLSVAAIERNEWNYILAMSER